LKNLQPTNYEVYDCILEAIAHKCLELGCQYLTVCYVMNMDMLVPSMIKIWNGYFWALWKIYFFDVGCLIDSENDVFVLQVLQIYIPSLVFWMMTVICLCSSMADDSGQKRKHLKTVVGQLLAFSHVFK
jgi:hypothetical protein